MKQGAGEAVVFCLITSDDWLESAIVEGLAAGGLDNEVFRVPRQAAAKGDTGTGTHNSARLILLDMRSPNERARLFLNEAQRHHPDAPPVVILIADRDEETEGLDRHTNMIAGRISSSQPADELLNLVQNALSDNWSMEDVVERP